ncbi:response regulator [Labilibaculum sp. K2S]|uniref:response regulator n=1 Tax=Labilibaculum sp. K2S TaxID=3056386 RepID=UPI003FA5E5A9
MIEKIRKDLQSEIPIIALSANRQEDFVIEALMLGADIYITKPFKPGELFLRVKRLLGS